MIAHPFHTLWKNSMPINERFRRGQSRGGVAIGRPGHSIFVTNANIFILFVCIPLGGLATRSGYYLDSCLLAKLYWEVSDSCLIFDGLKGELEDGHNQLNGR